MSRSERRHLRRGHVYHVATTDDRDPKRHILDILHQHPGESIVIRVYRKGLVSRGGTFRTGEFAGARYNFTMEPYDVPPLRPGGHPFLDINQAFKGRSRDGWYWDWKTGSTLPDGFRLQIGDELRVFRASELPRKRRRQRFASGVSHCVLTPMREWAQEHLDHAQSREGTTAKTKAAIRQDKSRYRGYLRVIDEYEAEYSDGIPEDAFQPFVAALGKYVNTHIVIELPLQGGAVVDVKSKACKKVWRFTNTRLDHVDLNEVTSCEPTIVERAELIEMLAELDANGTFYTYQQSRGYGITSVSTLKGSFRLASAYTDAVRVFEKETGVSLFKLDALGDRQLSDFWERAMHYNVTGVNCYRPGTHELPPLISAMLGRDEEEDAWPSHAAFVSERGQAYVAAANDAYVCLDIHKSYASFHTCALYETEKFPSKITTLRPTDKLQGPGAYLIDELDWSGADPAFVRICKELLGDPYRDLNCYPRPDLVKLQQHGVRFKVLEGAWADGYKPYFDFRFPGEPRNAEAGTEPTGMYCKDERNVPFYSRWAGACNQICKYKTYWMKGDRDYFENMASYLPENSNVRYCEDGAAKIEFKRKAAPHLTQITAYLNAYERIRLIDQLLEMQLDKVVWIDKDDITCERHDFRVLPCMQTKRLGHEKGEKHFSNSPSSCYLSNIWQVDGFWQVDSSSGLRPQLQATAPIETRPGGVVACLGVGGGGKTHVNLTDHGLRHVLFVPPSYDLLEAKQREYGVHGKVRDVALGQNYDSWKAVADRYAVIVWDEVSEWWMQTLKMALERYPYHKHILCGDPEYQLPPIKPAGETRQLVPLTQGALLQLGIPVHRFDYSHRVKCEALRDVCNRLRAMIDEGCSEQQMNAYAMSVMRARGQVLTFTDCLQRFDIEDAILVSRTKDPDYIAEYTTPLQEREFWRDGVRVRRFRVLEKAPLPNGRIVIQAEAPFPQCVERYASSVHAYQGKTSKYKTFIDNRRMFEVQHWYTAFSRAEYLHNVFIVNVPPPPPTDVYAQTFIYRIWSPHTPLVYIGHGTTTIEKRMQGHRREFADKTRTKRCKSAEVLAHGDAQIALIEQYPCASLQAAKARERFWIERTPQCVNQNIPGRTSEEYKQRAQTSAPLPPVAPTTEPGSSSSHAAAVTQPTIEAAPTTEPGSSSSHAAAVTQPTIEAVQLTGKKRAERSCGPWCTPWLCKC